VSATTIEASGAWVELDVTGEKMPCFVAGPAAPRGGVIVLQEIFGVNADMQRIVTLLADAGWLAIAPALFHRTDPHFDAAHDEAGFAKGRAAVGALTLEQSSADMTAAGDYLRDRLGPGAKIGTWGFCLGGSLAYFSATLPFVGAAVVFYGGQIATGSVWPPMLVVTEQIGAPLLLAFGGRDAHISADHVERIREALEAHGKHFELRIYAAEDHGFFRAGPDANDGARDVWPRVTAFLERNLVAD